MSQKQPAERQPLTARVDMSPQLFAVLCALHAAGYDANVSDANFHPIRARMRAEMLRQNGPATQALREFYNNHLLADSAATLARYVTFALSVGEPPKFRYSYNRDELPPEVLALEGFQELMINFYNEANLAEHWKTVQADYDREVRRVQLPVQPMVFTAIGYLREVIRPQLGRTFVIFVDPMIGGKTAFRNIGEDYSIVLSPSADLPLDEIRHAFLHFMLDPLPYRYKAATNAKRMLLNYAARAPRLPREFKEEFESFLSECMVRAVELRLSKLSSAELSKTLEALDADGFALVRPLYRELENNFEKAEPAMSYYFGDLMRGIHIGEESKRIEKIAFAQGSTARSHLERPESNESAAANVELSELELWLREGGRQIAARDAAGASETFERILAKYPGEARAVYGRAVSAAMQNDAEKAKALFLQLLSGFGTASSAVPPVERAWSHVYLGRIYDLEGNRELAVSEYKAALSVDGAPEAAKLAAQRGIEQSFPPRPKGNSP